MAILTKSETSRVNARLDPERTLKMRQLEEVNDLSTSDVMKKAIDVLYEQDVGSSRKSAHEILTESGFIGMAADPEAAHPDYKEELRRILEAKHGHR